MLSKQKSSGQAIVLIVFAIIGLIGITALAIDAGNAFGDRRAAQSAADNSALAAALSIVKGDDNGTCCTNVDSIGMVRASSNGFPSNGGSVAVNHPPAASCNGSNGTYVGNNDYVQVIIHSNVNTFFGSIIGISQVHNCVEAIAKAKKGSYTQFASGNAIAAMACHGKKTINSTGNSNSVLINGGVFSNSDDAEAILINKISNLVISHGFGVTAVGGVNYPNGYSPTPITGATQIPCPLPDYWYPKDAGQTDGYVCNETGNNFPDDFGLDAVEGGVPVYRMVEGKTYCVTGAFKQPNKVLNGQNVHIVMINNGIHWNGNAEFNLSAAADANNPGADPLNGIIIYLPRPNSSPIILNGSANSTISGTIFAPNSDVSLNGDFNGTAWQSQVIGATVDLSGAIDFSVNYLGALNGGYITPPVLELTK